MDQAKILKSAAVVCGAAIAAGALWIAVRGTGYQPLPDLGPAPSFSLTAQTGRPFASQELEGQVWVASFVFSSCTNSCPMLAAQMKRLQASLPKQGPYRLVSVSVDPERDTPQRLARYARDLGIEDERWVFLTGKKAEIRKMVVEGFKLAAEPGVERDKDILHSSKLVLVDKAGRIRGYYDGLLSESAEQIRGAAELLARL